MFGEEGYAPGTRWSRLLTESVEERAPPLREDGIVDYGVASILASYCQ